MHELLHYAGRVPQPVAAYRPANVFGALGMETFLQVLGLAFYSPLAALEKERADLIAEEQSIIAAVEAAGGKRTDEQKARLVAIDARFSGETNIDTELATERRRAERLRSEPAADAGGPEITFTQPSPEDKAPTPFGHFGGFLQAVQASALAIKNGRAPDSRITAIQDHARVMAAATGLGEEVGSDGGFAVQTDMQDRILDQIEGEAVLWPQAFPIPLSPNSNGVKVNQLDETSRVTGSRLGGVQVYWEPEATAATAKKPKIFPLELTLKKLFGLGYRTDELGQDWLASGVLLERAFTAEMAFALDDAFVRGTGAGIPMGILNSDALVSVSKETGQAAATLVAENIFNMFARMPARSKRRAAWYINGDVWPQIFALHQVIGTGGTPLFIPTGALGDAPGGTILGRPVIEIEQAATLGTVGDVLFVDPKEYLRLEKGGVQRASSIHVAFLTDEEVFRWILRTNGAPAWKSAVTPYKGSNTRSPYIALATRS